MSDSIQNERRSSSSVWSMTIIVIVLDILNLIAIAWYLRTNPSVLMGINIVAVVVLTGALYSRRDELLTVLRPLEESKAVE